MEKRKYLVLAVTGGIASGKSFVTGEFEKLGARIIDADKIARDAVKPGSALLRRLVKVFGPGIMDKNGELLRKKLGEIVFGNPRKRRRLDALSHPVIIREMKQQLRSTPAGFRGIVVIDAPLLFEAKLEKLADKILLVWVPRALQRERLKKRDGLSGAEISRRLSSQMSLDKKAQLSDYVLDNSKTKKISAGEALRLYWRLMPRGHFILPIDKKK